MRWDEYTAAARRTMPGGLERREELAMLAMGVAGESGEIVDALKKALYHGHSLNHAHLAEELGDLCWYLANLMTLLDVSFDDVLAANIAKLRKRYPQGFSAERSRHRSQ